MRLARIVGLFGVSVAVSFLAGCAHDGAKADAGATPGASCTTDADCRLFSAYCGGCACRVVAKGAADPTCAGTLAQCFVDPCMQKTAVCAAGACAVGPAPTR